MKGSKKAKKKDQVNTVSISVSDTTVKVIVGFVVLVVLLCFGADPNVIANIMHAPVAVTGRQ
ncbi:hypothetical protein [Kribbella sp. NPDC000426]|uniref:hypothetical protein n=1 Tax=Kribbella sp. NPDC000426 TaxID=3154255 RepID=UPI00331C3FFC